MKNFNKRVALVCCLLVLYVFIKSIFKLDNYSFYNYYINPIIWLLLMLSAIFIIKDDISRIKDRFGKFQTLLILSILYLIIYFALGLLFGFERSPYSRNFFTMLVNIWAFVSLIFFQEKIRSILVNYMSNKLVYKILLIMLFVFINFNFSEFLSNVGSLQIFFKYIFGTFLPLLIQQTLFNYLMRNCGFKSVMAFRFPIEICYIVIPIFPKLDWFLLGLYNLVFYFAIFLIINYEYGRRNKFRSYRKSMSNPIMYIPLLVFIVVFISFVMGFFKYRPVAVMSNSMVPIFSRGDMVIIKNISKEDIQKLAINDIIEYSLDNHIVIHRIIAIEENEGVLYFKTKGDNNNAPDMKYVSESQVTGVTKMVIPVVGYPTVWLSDLFKTSKPDVEMG